VTVDHRRLGVDLFNEVWRLMKSREDDERMLYAVHAMRYHWGEAPECTPANLARAEWQIARVYAVLGRAEPALRHAQRCLEHCEANGLGDWDLAVAYEALARAHKTGGDEAACAAFKERAAAVPVADADDRAVVERDLATL
jgi:hypothetical protein